MDKPTQYREDNEAEQPQDDQHNTDSPQHMININDKLGSTFLQDNNQGG